MTLDATKVKAPTTRRIVSMNNMQIRVPIDMEQIVVVEADRIIINDRVTLR